MKNTVAINTLKKVLIENEIDTRRILKITEDIYRIIDSESEEKEAPIAKQFVIVLSAPDGEIQPEGEATGWILQIPENAHPGTAKERLIKAAQAYNMSPKGRRFPVESIGEACESIPTKISKEFQVWFRTRRPVIVLFADNARSIPQATN